MNVDTSLRDLLVKIEAGLPRGGPWPGKVNVTSDFLLHMVDKQGALLANERRGLERISRKIDIAKAVHSTYDADWRRPIGSEPLASPFQPLLVALLIDAALRTDRSTNDGLGTALKFANSACNGLDLCSKNRQDSVFGELEQTIRAALDQIVPL